MSTATRTSFGWADHGTFSSANTANLEISPDFVSQAAPGATIRLEPAFSPFFTAFAPWLPAVEQRINAATLPDGYRLLEKSEWVSEDVGAAAIRFFQNVADILPGEPFIYGSKTGALVAEFQTTSGALTTVISPNAATLFAVKKDEPEEPIQITVKRGSNRLREDLKDIAQALTASHGTMGSATQR